MGRGDEWEPLLGPIRASKEENLLSHNSQLYTNLSFVSTNVGAF